MKKAVIIFFICYAAVDFGARVANAADAAAPAAAPIILYASGDYNLRESPNGKVKKIIPKGAKFYVHGQSQDGDWFTVTYGGLTGVVYKDALTYPTVAALKAQKSVDLSHDSPAQIAEIAACLDEVSVSSLPPQLKKTIESLQKHIAKPAAPESTEPDDPRMRALSGPKVACLKAQAWIAASKWRAYAPHVCARMGAKYPCGGSANPHRSKGWCLGGVHETLLSCLHLDLGRPVNGHKVNSAMDSIPNLKAELVNIAAKSCADAPEGSVCVYSAACHNWGHIEVKVNAHEYCSDFCSDHPMNTGPKTKRNSCPHTFLGAYYP